MSDYIEKNSLTPGEALNSGLDAGAATMKIRHNNGALEVVNGTGAILLQAKNVKDGTWNTLWAILENCGDIDYRAGD